jgi:hypothetical protein
LPFCDTLCLAQKDHNWKTEGKAKSSWYKHDAHDLSEHSQFETKLPTPTN